MYVTCKNTYIYFIGVSDCRVAAYVLVG